MSKDPTTRVGAVICGPDRESLCSGFNGFPRLVADTPQRLTNREIKLELVVHAEMNAILVAAKRGISLSGCTLYYSALDQEGNLTWGGPPCTRCMVAIVQVGIRELVTYQVRPILERWSASMKLSREVLEETGIRYREVLPNA
jgi:dCMP deaminase